VLPERKRKASHKPLKEIHLYGTRDGDDFAELRARAEGNILCRELTMLPPNELTPGQYRARIKELAKEHGWRREEFDYSQLKKMGAGAFCAVAQGSETRDAAIVHLSYTHSRAKRTAAVVGKGICFDTGGLDIKPGSAMALMKKDMGGAAAALAFALLVMRAKLPVRLRVLIPAAENSIAGNAFRPGDVLRTRKGLFVEIGNTDAEGRLVLGDALARACEEQPVLVLDFATLTGAARVALGPDLPALFANDEALAGDIAATADAVADPLWRLPLWQPYNDMLKSDVADINNAPGGGFAGTITAALFLERFVSPSIPWAHLDTFAWRPTAKPGRPKGGDALGLRAAWELLRRRFAN